MSEIHSIVIREIKTSDYQLFKILLLDFYEEINHRFSTENLDEIVRDFAVMGGIYLALEQDKIIGFITAIESNAIYARGRFGVINELYILPEYRSQQIGQKLIHFLIELAKIKHWQRLELDTPEIEKSQKTIHFYKKQGFVPVGYRMKLHLK